MRRSVLSLALGFAFNPLVQALPAIVPTDPSRFTFYNLPEPLSGPCDLCKGTDGALWGQDQLVNELFRIDPNTGKIDTFVIPFTLPPIKNATLIQAGGRTAFSCAIRPGADGNIYSAFGTRNQLVRINPKTKKIDVFTPDNLSQPVGNLQPFNDLFTAKDGIYFTQTTANLFSFFDFKTEKITSWTVPTPLSDPLGVFVDSAGTPWMAEFTGNKIASFNRNTGKFTEYVVPLSLSTPAVIRAETENRYIWFTALTANAVGRFDKVTKQFKTYANPLAGGFATEDTVDSKGNVWFSSLTQNTLSKIDGKTGNITQIVIPGTTTVAPVSVPPGVVIAMNYGPGDNMWFTEEALNRVGKYRLS